MIPISYIQKSATVNALITGKVAISSDGVTWEYLPKEGLSVSPIFSGIGGLNYPYATKTIVVLRYRNGSGESYSFDIQGVKNQATWQGGTQAKLKIALDDIAAWLN